MDLLEYQTMPSLRYVAHSCEYLYYTTATGNSIRYWNNGSPVRYQNATVPDRDAGCRNTDASSICLDAYFQLWETGTFLTNHLIMGLLRETRTPSLDTSCKEGMAWCSSIPTHSLWSVYCVLRGSVALTRTHWPMYRACIHKASLLKKKLGNWFIFKAIHRHPYCCI